MSELDRHGPLNSVLETALSIEPAPSDPAPASLSSGVESVRRQARAMGGFVTAMPENARAAFEARATDAMMELSSTATALTKAARLTGASDAACLIAGMAEQTNRLALTAILQSARAAEAGGGFAAAGAQATALAQHAALATRDLADHLETAARAAAPPDHPIRASDDVARQADLLREEVEMVQRSIRAA